jgi:hypothetical protein
LARCVETLICEKSRRGIGGKASSKHRAGSGWKAEKSGLQGLTGQYIFKQADGAFEDAKDEDGVPVALGIMLKMELKEFFLETTGSLLPDVSVQLTWEPSTRVGNPHRLVTLFVGRNVREDGFS